MKKCLTGMMVVLTAVILAGIFATAAHAGSKETAKDGRFIAYDDGTVLDTKTSLMWAAKDNGSALNWLAGKEYCESYRAGGYKDWRLPTQDELAGLYDKTTSYKNDNGKEVHVTKLIYLTTSYLWASESSVLPNSRTISHSDTASIFIFGRGRKLSVRAESVSEVCVLPVRSVK